MPFYDDTNDYLGDKWVRGGAASGPPGVGPGAGFGGGGSLYGSASTGLATPFSTGRRLFPSPVTAPMFQGAAPGSTVGGNTGRRAAPGAATTNRVVNRVFGAGGPAPASPPAAEFADGSPDELYNSFFGSGRLNTRSGFMEMLSRALANGQFDPAGSPQIAELIRQIAASEMGAREHAARTHAMVRAGDDPSLAAFMGGQARRDVASDVFRGSLDSRSRQAEAFQEWIRSALAELISAEGIQGGAGDKRRFQGGGGFSGLVGQVLGSATGGWLSPGGLVHGAR